MSYAPNTIVKLCNVPFDRTQANQIRFTTTALQTTYFESVATHAYTDFTFQRRDNAIRVLANIDIICDCNYVMYNNLHFTSRYFYAFITKMEYVNDTTTLIYIETDVYQTWFISNCTLKTSFVLREHEVTDTIGINLIDEGLELGDIVANGVNAFCQMGQMDIIIATVKSDEGITANGDIYNGIYSGCWLYGSTDPDKIGAFIGTMELGPGTASILSIFMVPHLFTLCTADLTLLNPNNLVNNININNGPSRPATLDGYTPKNAKLKTFPYSFLYVHNNAGNSAIFKWELFTAAPTFLIYGSVGPNAVYKLIPMSLESAGYSQPDYDQGLTLGGFPVCAWNSNVYSNWIAQNSGSVIIGLAGGALTIGAGIVAANPMIVAGGALAVGGSLASLSAKSMQPPQANGSVNSPNANCTNEWNDFIMLAKSIRAGYAAIIDNYWEMYGYKQNKVKLPNMSSRPYWNYVKTIDANIQGDIPAQDMEALKKVFDNGVTFWHAAANVGNYALNNH